MTCSLRVGKSFSIGLPYIIVDYSYFSTLKMVLTIKESESIICIKIPSNNFLALLKGKTDEKTVLKFFNVKIKHPRIFANNLGLK